MRFLIQSLEKDISVSLKDKTYKFTKQGEEIELSKIQLQELCTELTKRDYPDKNYVLRQKFAGVIICLAHYVAITDVQNSRRIDIAGIGKKTFDVNRIFYSEEEDKEYKEVQKSMTIQACNKYLENHTVKTPVYINGKYDEKRSSKIRSNGRYTQQVLQIKKRILEMENESTILMVSKAPSARYVKFIKEYPDHKLIPDIKAKYAEVLEEEEYIKCMSADKSETCDDFIEKYPESAYLETVEKQRLELIKNELYQTALMGTQEECQAFLSLYTVDDETRANIQQRLNKLIADEELTAEESAADIALAGSVEDCEEYLEKFPNGVHADQIREKIVEIEYLSEAVDTMDDEQRAYLDALNGTVDDCKAYLEKYPKEGHVEHVNARIAEIEEAEKQLQAQEEQTKEEDK